MLFSCSNPVLHIWDATQMQWSSGIFSIAPRRYSSLAFRIRGDAVITVRGKEYHTKENEVLYLPQGLGYEAKYSDTEIAVIHFRTERDDPEPEIYSFANGERIYHLFLQVLALRASDPSGSVPHVMSGLYAILAALSEQSVQSSMPAHFVRAVALINAHFSDSDLSVSAVCREAGMSETSFRSLFRKYYQKTPGDYITDLRLSYARTLIAGGMPIEAAAGASGYRDPKYFSRLVRKQFGCTPRMLKLYGK